MICENHVSHMVFAKQWCELWANIFTLVSSVQRTLFLLCCGSFRSSLANPSCFNVVLCREKSLLETLQNKYFSNGPVINFNIQPAHRGLWSLRWSSRVFCNFWLGVNYRWAVLFLENWQSLTCFSPVIFFPPHCRMMNSKLEMAFSM